MSGLYILAMIGHVAFLRHRGEALLEPGRKWLRFALAFLFVSSFAAGVVNVAGMGGLNSFSLYIVSIIVGLIFAGVLFLSVASDVYRSQSR
jgi:hypothetical protein